MQLAISQLPQHWWNFREKHIVALWLLHPQLSAHWSSPCKLWSERVVSQAKMECICDTLTISRAVGQYNTSTPPVTDFERRITRTENGIIIQMPIFFSFFFKTYLLFCVFYEAGILLQSKDVLKYNLHLLRYWSQLLHLKPTSPSKFNNHVYTQ